MDGPTPWFAALAVLASIAGIIQGGVSYSDYQDAKEQLEKAVDQLPGFP
jgi:hypothetical protein